LDYAWFRSGGWESTLSYSYFQTINNQVAFFNVQNQFVGLGGSYRGQVAAMPFQVGVQYTYDDTSLRDFHFLSRNSVNAYATLVEDQTHLTTVQGRFQQKDFTTTFLPLPEDIRDGQNWMAGITHVMRFAGDKHYFRIGYQYDTENSVGPNWSYRGHRALAGFQYTLPWKEIRLKYDYDIYKRTYPIPNSLFPQDAPYTTVQKVLEQNHWSGSNSPCRTTSPWSRIFKAPGAKPTCPCSSTTTENRHGQLVLVLLRRVTLQASGQFPFSTIFAFGPSSRIKLPPFGKEKFAAEPFLANVPESVTCPATAPLTNKTRMKE
jgi:hypothetical protein